MTAHQRLVMDCLLHYCRVSGIDKEKMLVDAAKTENEKLVTI